LLPHPPHIMSTAEADAGKAPEQEEDDSRTFVKLIRCGTGCVVPTPCLCHAFSTHSFAPCTVWLHYIGSSPLHSRDGFEFVVERRFAMVSGTIKAMLTGSFSESKGEARFPEIRGEVLERIVQYFHHKVKYHNSRVPIPDFPVPPELSLEMLLAANFLDC